MIQVRTGRATISRARHLHYLQKLFQTTNYCFKFIFKAFLQLCYSFFHLMYTSQICKFVEGIKGEKLR
jgi:hypothetical protein